MNWNRFIVACYKRNRSLLGQSSSYKILIHFKKFIRIYGKLSEIWLCTDGQTDGRTWLNQLRIPSQVFLPMEKYVGDLNLLVVVRSVTLSDITWTLTDFRHLSPFEGFFGIGIRLNAFSVHIHFFIKRIFVSLWLFSNSSSQLFYACVW